MADADTEITKEELQKEIAGILDNASLDKTSTKKVIQKLEQKLGVDLSEKKKLIDQLVMDYVNSMESEEEEPEVEEEPPKKKPAVRKAKKRDDDEDDEEHDDSNDSDWGYHHHHDGHLLDGHSDESYHPLPQESTITTTGMRHLSSRPIKALILQRVTPNYADEADIFGRLTAKKLRKLSDEQRDSMMKQINQLFYDKFHKRSTPPKRIMVDKSTGMPPVIECSDRHIFRIDCLPKNLTTPPRIVGINLANLLGTSIDVPKTVVPPSNVPEPVVQEATTPKPPDNASTGYKCGLM